MALHRIKKGLRLPIVGEPEQRVDDGKVPTRVALVAADYRGLRPTMHVQPGDQVRRGQLLFEDKKMPGVRFTAIAGGKVTAVHRGAKRALQSVVIELDADERAGRASTPRFSADHGKHPGSLSEDQVKELLIESGMWTAIRARPFGKIANPDKRPSSIFVTAMDSDPLAADPAVVLQGRGDDFERGLAALGKLTGGPVYVCTAPGGGAGLQLPRDDRFRVEEFAGPHPAGTVGVHIHLLDPVHRRKRVWHCGYQDVAAVGRLFDRGELDVTRVVALAGPAVDKPRLIRTRVGASTDALVAGEVDGEALAREDLRLISGSVLSGRKAQGEILGYLGRYHQQLSVLREDRQRELLGWLMPGANRFSTLNLFLSRLMPGKKFELTTTTHGSDRAIVPLGLYERVFPIDIPATFLLRSIVVGDVERAEELGVLELDEEDLALCSFVDPGKHDFGVHLRDLLTTIEKEG
jgi:Na+-transporting NADH:ubiquinone oxidoreductase subunit A